MVLAASIGALGAMGAAGISALGASSSNANTLAMSKELQEHQALINYKFAKKTALNSPGWNRQGLISANYNPMLALGLQNAQSGWTSSAVANSSDMSSIVSNAINTGLALRQQINQNALSESQVSNYNADTLLKNNQAFTELYTQLEKLNHADLLDAQKRLTDKDISSYDRRQAREDLKVSTEIERVGNDFKVGMANAIANQIGANASVTSANANARDVENRNTNEKNRLKWDKERFGIGAGLAGLGSLFIPGVGQVRALQHGKKVFNALHFIK